jgi:HEAT repeat protein
MTDSNIGSPGVELEALLAALAGGDEAAEAAVRTLAALAPAESAAAFERLAESAAWPDPERRWWAVRAMAALAHIDPLPALIAALRDPDAAIRQCAALGVRMRPDLRAVAALITCLADSDALTARLAADALVAIGPEAAPTLIEALSGNDLQPAARLGALRALAAIGDTRAIPALFAALDGSTLEEYWASQGLERMGVGMSFFKP